MKKTYIKRLIKIISLVLVLAVILGLSQRYYMKDTGNNSIRLRGFELEDPNSLDVVVLGASEVYSDFSAVEFYEKTGVTSYPYAYAANPVTFWKYELKEILRTQKPKVLVVETNGVVYGDDMLYKEASVRYLADNMKLLPEKMELVEKYGTDDKLSYFFPIIKYHGEWQNRDRMKNALTMLKMDMRGYSLLKGSFSHTAHKKMDTKQRDHDPDKKKELNPEAEKYLREFLEDCQNSGIEHILFVRFPHQVVGKKSVQALERCNRAAEIVGEYGFEYVDLDDYCEEADIHKPDDFHNSDHLMMTGQKKFTDFLAKYLTDRYDLQPTQLTEKQEKEWQECCRYMKACFAYFEDYRKNPTENDEYVIYEREKNMKDIEKYL